jgi:hypothetical protein
MQVITTARYGSRSVGRKSGRFVDVYIARVSAMPFGLDMFTLLYLFS